MSEITGIRLGRRSYGEVHSLQAALVAARQRGEIGDTVLFVEHSPVVTFGRKIDVSNLIATPQLLQSRGVEVHETGRGGDVTFHGPGQMVMYPIIDLAPIKKDVRKYVNSLEEVMLRVCAAFDVVAERAEGMNGAWVGQNKIGAIGVRISRWVTMHGIALNVSTDLSYFDLIIPCGITGRGVTSLEKETSRRIALDAIESLALGELARLYSRDHRFGALADLPPLPEASVFL